MSEVMVRPKWTWEEVHQTRHWGTCPEPAMARFVRRRLNPGMLVLDVGCGVGAQAFWLASAGFEVNAIDISPTAILRLQDRRDVYPEQCAGWWHHILARVEDVTERLAFADDSLDAAIDVCCLQHIVQPDRLSKALSEIRRVLKPGGWLFSVLASDRHSPIAFGGMDARTYRMAEAVALFKHAGFNLVTVHSKEHTDDFIGDVGLPRVRLVAHWLIEAVKKDA